MTVRELWGILPLCCLDEHWRGATLNPTGSWSVSWASALLSGLISFVHCKPVFCVWLDSPGEGKQAERGRRKKKLYLNFPQALHFGHPESSQVFFFGFSATEFLINSFRLFSSSSVGFVSKSNSYKARLHLLIFCLMLFLLLLNKYMWGS